MGDGREYGCGAIVIAEKASSFFWGSRDLEVVVVEVREYDVNECFGFA